MSSARGTPLTRFLRTPKGSLLAILLVMLAVAGRVEGPRAALILVVASVVPGALIDVLFIRWRDRAWRAPVSAVITGLLVAGVLGTQEPWFVGAAASTLGIVSKRVLRTRWTNVVNPAAFGLVCVYYLFDSALSWWGALPGIVPAAAWPILGGAGIYLTQRVRRGTLVIAFFATYFLLFSAATFVLEPGDVAEVFVTPDLQAVVLFATFMLTDPPTSPAPGRAQAIAGVIVGASCVAIFVTAGAAHFLLSGLLIGNVWESVRRMAAHRLRRRLRG